MYSTSVLRPLGFKCTKQDCRLVAIQFSGLGPDHLLCDKWSIYSKETLKLVYTECLSEDVPHSEASKL